MSAPGRVCVVGSANLDLVASTPRLPAPGETVLGSDFAEHAGGKGLNQAVAAARAGAATTFVGALGRDDAGRFLLDQLAAAGIEAVVATSDRPTGRAVITVDDRGENSIVVVAGANGEVSVTTLPPSDVVLTQLEIPIDAMAAALELARAGGARTVLNPAPAVVLPARLFPLIDVLVPNEHEVALLGTADALIAAGVGAVVTTLGAGDAFCGALAARLAAGDPLDLAVRAAAAAGALATTRRGAVPSMPMAADIAALLAS